MLRPVIAGMCLLMVALAILLAAPNVHGADMKVVLACPDAVRVGAQFGITIAATNNRSQVVNVTRGAIVGHLGNLSTFGPVSFPASATLQPGQTATFGPFTFTMPSVAASTFVSVGVALLGKVGADTKRRVLGGEHCPIEVNP